MGHKVPEVIPESCGECAYFTKTGKLDRFKGFCDFYEQETFSNHKCIAHSLLSPTSESSPSEQAFKAARIANTKQIIKLLDEGLNPSIVDENGDTLLLTAVRTRNKDLLQYLLDTKVNLNIANKAGMTALMLAVEQENKTFVELLIQSKADLDVKNEGGWTALSFAKRRRRKPIFYLLVQAGATDPENYTARMASRVIPLLASFYFLNRAVTKTVRYGQGGPENIIYVLFVLGALIFFLDAVFRFLRFRSWKKKALGQMSLSG